MSSKGSSGGRSETGSRRETSPPKPVESKKTSGGGKNPSSLSGFEAKKSGAKTESVTPKTEVASPKPVEKPKTETASSKSVEKPKTEKLEQKKAEGTTRPEGETKKESSLKNFEAKKTVTEGKRPNKSSLSGFEAKKTVTDHSQKPVEQKPVTERSAEAKPVKPVEQKSITERPAEAKPAKPVEQKPVKPMEQKPAAEQKTDTSREKKAEKTPEGSRETAENTEKKSISQQRLEKANKELQDTIDKHYEKDPEKKAQLQELRERMQKETKPLYEASKEVSARAPEIRNFSDHNMAHISEVAKASMDNVQAVHKMEEAQKLPAEARVKDEVVLAAALWHDVGMAGTEADRKLIEADPKAVLDGDRIRKEHSFQSSQAILERQDQFSNQAEAVEAAWLAYMHSKSSSDVPTLSDTKAMTDALNRVKAEYGKNHPEAAALDLSSFGQVDEKGDLVKMTDEVRTRINNETVILRVADSQRPADACTTMTGRIMDAEKTVYTDASGFDKKVVTETHLKQAEYTDPGNPEDRENCSKEAAVKFITGERNVDAGGMKFTKDGGAPRMEVSYVVKDAYADQAATKAILLERMAEATSTTSQRRAVEGCLTRENLLHVVELENGDEALRARLEKVLREAIRAKADRKFERTDADGKKVWYFDNMSADVKVVLKDRNNGEKGE